MTNYKRNQKKQTRKKNLKKVKSKKKIKPIYLVIKGTTDMLFTIKGTYTNAICLVLRDQYIL